MVGFHGGEGPEVAGRSLLGSERCGHGVVPAVDMEHFAGDRPREIRQQETHGIGNW